ncbi:unnamed protein product, partial [Tenebrio molitor]
QWNLYNVLFINGTIWVTKNGNIIKQITSFAPERIYVKFPSNDNTSWMVFNENMRKSSANVHSSWKVMLTIATFISLARSLLIV